VKRAIGVAAVVMVAALVLAGCRGEEVARVKLTKPGDSADTTWKAAGAESVQLWADYAGDWTGGKNPGLDYMVELVEGTTVVQTKSCQTGSCTASVCGNTLTVGNKTSGDCECKMACTLDAPKAGTYTVKAKVSDPAGHMTASKNVSLVLRK
jgi:hypothetical protein